MAAEADVDRVVLGRIVGVSGLRGALKVFSDTQPRESIGKYSHWLLRQRDGWRRWPVEWVKPQGKRLIGKLEGCDARESAEALIGATIAIDAEQLEPLGDSRYYWRDLQGLEVLNETGFRFGEVKRIFDTGANDVLVVRGEKEHLIPWVLGDVVKNVDLDSSTLIVDWDPEF